jgi:AbrB family looped-hinge helix DNA binding protein
MQSTMTGKGQVTLPKPVRDHLGLKPGDRVKFFTHPNGTVVMLPMRPASSLRGILERPGQKPITIEEMDKAIGKKVGERDARGKWQ